jgi:hypothetical protein
MWPHLYKALFSSGGLHGLHLSSRRCYYDPFLPPLLFTQRSMLFRIPAAPSHKNTCSFTSRSTILLTLNLMPGLSPFAQRKKPNRGLRLLSPRNPYSPSPTNRNRHRVSANQRTILSRWKHLNNLESINHQQLAPLVNVEENRNFALVFREKDAIVVINAIDKVRLIDTTRNPATLAHKQRLKFLRFKALKQVEGPDKTRSNALKLLRRLAGNTRQVPKSYTIGRWTRYTVREEIIAGGGYADVREGRLGHRVIAIKTLRVSQETNIDDLHKVCDAVGPT